MNEHLYTSMSHWNHRVVREYSESEESFNYSIREVYYENKEETKIWGWSAEPRAAFGNDIDDLKANLTRMLECCNRPVLTLVKKDGKEELI